MLKEHQVDRLQIILHDEGLLETINQVLMETVEDNKPKLNIIGNNQLLGEQYRAYIEARGMLEAGMKSLQSYKKIKLEPAQINRAR